MHGGVIVIVKISKVKPAKNFPPTARDNMLPSWAWALAGSNHLPAPARAVKNVLFPATPLIDKVWFIDSLQAAFISGLEIFSQLAKSWFNVPKIKLQALPLSPANLSQDPIWREDTPT